MLIRFLGWLFGAPKRTPDAKPDPLALSVSRRQRAVAERLAPVTKRTPEDLLDYHRADGILSRRR